MCAKLHTVAASNNRDHLMRSLLMSPLASTINCSPGSQALLEVTHQDHSIIDSHHAYIFLFFAHIPFMVNHTINATPPEKLQQHPLLFTTNHTDRTFFVWRLNSARPSHPGHSTILLCSEIPSSMYEKLRTVAASNNRDHPTRSLSSSLLASTINCSPGSQALLEDTHQDHSIGITLLLVVRTTHIYFCSLHTSLWWWITQSTQHHRRGCNTTV